jgi:transposase
VVINPIVVKSLLRVEGKSDKDDAMTLARLAASFDLKTSNMPDSQQRELRLLFKRVDAWKMQRTQSTNRANGTR